MIFNLSLICLENLGNPPVLFRLSISSLRPFIITSKDSRSIDEHLLNRPINRSIFRSNLSDWSPRELITSVRKWENVPAAVTSSISSLDSRTVSISSPLIDFQMLLGTLIFRNTCRARSPEFNPKTSLNASGLGIFCSSEIAPAFRYSSGINFASSRSP